MVFIFVSSSQHARGTIRYQQTVSCAHWNQLIPWLERRVFLTHPSFFKKGKHPALEYLKAWTIIFVSFNRRTYIAFDSRWCQWSNSAAKSRRWDFTSRWDNRYPSVLEILISWVSCQTPWLRNRRAKRAVFHLALTARKMNPQISIVNNSSTPFCTPTKEEFSHE